MKLTINQQQAVHSEAKQTIVIAGAGSGKTTVLIKRLLHLLIERNVDPYQIMVLTFTRKAAGEMRARLEQWAVEQNHPEAKKMIERVTLGTFHKIALGFLRTHGDLLDYKTDSIGIIPMDDAELLLKHVSKEMGYFRNNKWKSGLSMTRVKHFIETYYNEGPSGRGVQMQRAKYPQIEQIFAEYQSQLKKMNLLDFGSILTETQRLFLQHPHVLDEYKANYAHVLVDEVQDTDLVQYTLHNYFCPPASLFIVGDPRQSIYGWRGARPELMTCMYPDAEVINLQENFRSEAPIVEASNKLIAHNTNMRVKPMVSTKGILVVNNPVEIISGRSEHVADCACLHNELGYDYSDIIVLARTHDILKYLARAFVEAGVPHHRVGGSYDICNTEEFKDIHAALRLCANPYDELAFLRLYKDLGMSDEMYADIKANAAKKGTSSMKYWCTLTHHESSPLCVEIAESYEHEHCLVKGYAVAFSECLGGTDTHRSVSLFWRRNCKNMPIESALRWFSFVDSQDDVKDGDHVTLSTIHAAKGLEYPVVIVADMNEGILPKSQAVNSDDSEAMQEERRVCYVAMTRAKDLLILHYRRPEDQHLEAVTQTGKVYMKKPKAISRFIYESESLLHEDAKDGTGVTEDTPHV